MTTIQNQRIQPTLLALIALVCFVTTPAKAFLDGHIYALQESPTEADSYTLVRMHINSSELEVLNELEPGLSIPHENKLTIDPLRKRLYMQAQTGDDAHKWHLRQYDLRTGALLESSAENLGRFATPQFNPADGKLYALEFRFWPVGDLEFHQGLTAFDPVTTERAHLGGLQYYPTASCTAAALDYKNNRYHYDFGYHPFIKSLRIGDGEHLGQFRTEESPRAGAYDPVSGKIYSLTLTTGVDGVVNLCELDTQAGELHLIRSDVVPAIPQGAEICRGQINPHTGEYIFAVHYLEYGARISNFYSIKPGVESQARFLTRMRNCASWALYVHSEYDNNSMSVSGQLMVDVDNNCAVDNGDLPIAHHELVFKPGGYKTFTDDAGHFQLRLPAGEYTATYAADTRWESFCAGNSDVITVKSGQAETIDLLARVNSEVAQSEVSLHSTVANDLERSVYFIEYTNTGALPFSGPVRLVANRDLRSVNSSMAIRRRNDRWIEWTLEAVPPGGQVQITLEFDLPSVTPSEPTGDGQNRVLCAFVEVVDRPGKDIRIAAHDCARIRYDGASGRRTLASVLYSEFVDAAQTRLRYTVHFTSLGNVNVDEIRMTDHFEDYVDGRSFTLIESSHPAHLWHNTYDVTIGIFNLDLSNPQETPAKNTAYMVYEVDLLRVPSTGSIIENRVEYTLGERGTYRSNTARNVIGGAVTDVKELTGQGLEPGHTFQVINSGGDQFILHSQSSVSGSFSVYSFLGQRLSSQNLYNQREARFDLSGHPRGAYFVHVETDGGNAFLPMYFTK